VTDGVALLRAREVVKTYGEAALQTTVLRGISLDLPSGALTLLVGPSGSGKTTLLSILAGLVRPTSGRVELCGEPLHDAPERAVMALRRAHLGFVFQGYNLFPMLTALDNVAEVLALKGMAFARARTQARVALDRVGLARRADALPGALSNGERQRVAVARALAGDPALVFGDEPTAALDGAAAADVMAILRDYVDPARAVLLVTHDHRLERFADRVISIEDGRLTGDRAGGWAP
jgi:putative ABC transport system ATP-binding protein